MEKTIEIPEGYEARIEGNKVIPEPKQDYSGLTDFERAIHRGFLCAGVENVPVDIIKDTAQDCLAHIKPAEWSDVEKMHLANAILAAEKEWGINSCTAKFLKSLRPQPKQESKPLEIKFAEKIYKVYGTKELPGGIVGYIIEDEPGHYDYIIHPDEVLGGGYGIKTNGSLYPTKEANFGQPLGSPARRR